MLPLLTQSDLSGSRSDVKELPSQISSEHSAMFVSDGYTTQGILQFYPLVCEWKNNSKSMDGF